MRGDSFLVKLFIIGILKLMNWTGKAGHLSTPKAKSERNDYLNVCP
jgi:hypothetical protein